MGLFETQWPSILALSKFTEQYKLHFSVNDLDDPVRHGAMYFCYFEEYRLAAMGQGC